MSDDGMFCPYKKSTKREVSYSWQDRDYNGAFRLVLRKEVHGLQQRPVQDA